MKNKIINALIYAFIVGLCLSAMIYTPQKIKRYIHNDNDIVSVVKKTDFVNTNTYEGEINGGFTGTRYIVIKLSRTAQEVINTSLFIDYGEGLRESDKLNKGAIEGSDYVVYELSGENYNKLKLFIFQTLEYVDSVEFHQSEPQFIYESIHVRIRYILLSIFGTLLAGLAGFLIESRWNCLEKILEYLSEKRKTIFKSIVVIAIAGVMAAIVNIIAINVIYGKIYFNPQLFVYIYAIILTICLFVASRKIIEKKTEKVVASAIFLIGLVMVFGSAPQHLSWDVDSHYIWALEDSYIGPTYRTAADYDVAYTYSEIKAYPNREESLFNMDKLNADYSDVIYGEDPSMSIPHVPAGIGIALARFFGLSFYWVFKFGELANLILYSTLIYFGIRKLKTGKMIMAVVSLFPTSLLLASSFSYDFWLTGFSLLGVAYFIGLAQSDDEISTKDTIIMVGALAAACIPKLIYLPLLIIPLLMPRNKIKNRKKYYLICITGFVVLLGMLLLQTIILTGGSGDQRGGATVNPGGQIALILGDPLGYADKLIKFLKIYLSIGGIRNYTLDFAYMGMGTFGVDLIVILMIVTAFTDKGVEDQYSSRNFVKTYMILMYFGLSALIATSLYISYTPVGFITILGCQSRYLIPLMYPLLSSIGSSKIQNNINKKIYNYIILGIMLLVAYVNVYSLVVSRMV